MVKAERQILFRAVAIREKEPPCDRGEGTSVQKQTQSQMQHGHRTTYSPGAGWGQRVEMTKEVSGVSEAEPSSQASCSRRRQEQTSPGAMEEDKESDQVSRVEGSG